MNKFRWTALLVMSLLALILTVNVLAMTSPGYILEWYLPGTGGGGGEASSANYAANFTIGQSVIGTSSSPNYGTGLGYWYGLLLDRLINLPIIFN